MSKSTKNNKKSIEEQMGEEYKKLGQLEHILLRPDSYIGSVAQDTKSQWIYDSDNNLIVSKDITYSSGFIKTVDELIVNARDHQIKDRTCENIYVTIDKENGYIRVHNDGNGVPVVKVMAQLKEDCPQEEIYVPELIFGHLLAGSNFNDDDRDGTVGGRNGYGAKLANIYSKKFIVETVYVNKKEKIFKKFHQVHKNNMRNKDNAEITKVSENTKPYTTITYYPDFEKFGMDEMSDDVISFLSKRAYDISACTSKKVKVYLNDKLIKIKGFEDFIKMHYRNSPELIYTEVGDRWKIGVVYDVENGGGQVSFVNGIFTSAGGTHVNYITDQITKKVTEHIKKKKDRKGLNIRPSQIKDHLTFFIDSIIENPGFYSQTKDILTTKPSDFGSECELTPGFIKKIIDTGLAELVATMAETKEQSTLKKSDGQKRSKILDIPKLDDAHWAGTKKSRECGLFLTEGDSAQSFATAGIEIIGHDKYGSFPLKGKFINVRKATPAQIKANEEFINLKKILGLKQGVKYTDVSKLRYGFIIILTDQDGDGSHIKGLLINMLQFYWPELLQIDGFVQTLSTPLIKICKKSDKLKKNPETFYILSEYEKWIEKETLQNNASKWAIPKYYKGLGTSTDQEAKEIFKNFDDRKITYIWEKYDLEGNELREYVPPDTVSDVDDLVSTCSTKSKTAKKVFIENPEHMLNPTIYKSKSYGKLLTGFDPKLADKRKDWLVNYDKNDILEYTSQEITYSDFIDKDLKHFSNYDNIRSIPSVVDGFKPSQRKVLFGMLAKNPSVSSGGIKVAQVASYISEHTAYKHGEKSLEDTIVGMAQSFTGSNNVNLLHPQGNFGHRKKGGDDSASSRYIFTYLESITKKIFMEHDDCILNRIIDEGDVIEPDYYLPIIPLILINGTQGMGTGWSTDVLQHNPMDIINNIFRKLDGKSVKNMIPWFYGYNGSVVEEKPNKYITFGKFKVISEDTIFITEIPMSPKSKLSWSDNYSEFLKTLVYDEKNNKLGKLLDVKPYCGTNSIKFEIVFKPGELQKMIKRSSDGKDEIEKYLKLAYKISSTNMWLHNSDGVITYYENATDILNYFYDFRLKMYRKRKENRLKILLNELNIIKYKVKFINEKINGDILLDNQSMKKLKEQLVGRKYPMLSLNLTAIDPPSNYTDEDDNVNDDNALIKTVKIVYKSHKYITDMKITSLTTDKIEELENKLKEKQREYDDYFNTTEEELWRRELTALLEFYNNWMDARIREDSDSDDNDTNKKSKSKASKSKKEDVPKKKKSKK